MPTVHRPGYLFRGILIVIVVLLFLIVFIVPSIKEWNNFNSKPSKMIKAQIKKLYKGKYSLPRAIYTFVPSEKGATVSRDISISKNEYKQAEISNEIPVYYIESDPQLNLPESAYKEIENGFGFIELSLCFSQIILFAGGVFIILLSFKPKLGKK